MTRFQSNLINLDLQSMFKKKNILTYMMIISIVILSGCDSDRFTADYGWASPILVEESVISMSEKGMVFVADTNLLPVTGESENQRPAAKFSPEDNHQNCDSDYLDKAGDAIYSTPAYSAINSTLVVGYYSGLVVGLRYPDLSLKWCNFIDPLSKANSSGGFFSFLSFGPRHQPDTLIGNITVHDGLAIMGTSKGFILAISIDTGNIKWCYNGEVTTAICQPESVLGSMYDSPLVDAGKVYLSSLDGSIYSLDVYDGTTKVPNATFFQTVNKSALISKPSALSGMFIITSLDRNIYVINKKDGSIITTLFDDTEKASGRFWAGSLINDNQIYTVTTNGRLYKFEIDTSGRKKNMASVQLKNRGQKAGENILITSSPILLDDTLIIVDSISGNIWEVSSSSFQSSNTVELSPVKHGSDESWQGIPSEPLAMDRTMYFHSSEKKFLCKKDLHKDAIGCLSVTEK